MALRDVLPQTWTQPGGRAHVGGVDLATIAARYGTPAYVFDVAHLRARMVEFGAALDGVGTPVYATKAFLCTAFAELLATNKWWVDVVSLGEAENVRRGGVPATDILLHGSLKTDAELDLAVKGDVAITVIDSLDELDRLERAAAGSGGAVDVMLRLNEDIDLATHPKVLTSGDEAKFGMVPEEASIAVKHIGASRTLRLRGVHLHMGSQATDPGLFGVIIERLVEFVARHRPAFKISPVLLNAGGGLASPYLRDDPVLDPALVVASMRQALVDTDTESRIGPVELMLEPGRALVANAGVLLYTVGVRKRLPAGGELIALDGGMTDNPRPALYGSTYELILVERADEEPDGSFRVFGRMCESDVLLESVRLPDSVGVGDVVAMPAAGAYTFSMSSRYNGLRRPPVLFVENAVVREVVRRETLDDVLAGQLSLDAAPTWSYNPGRPKTKPLKKPENG